MRRTIIALAGLLLLSMPACAVYYPELPGPADKVHCTIERDGSLVGVYECNIKGHYELSKW